MKRSLLTLVLLTSFNLTYANSGVEDKIADVASWVVLIVLPFVGVYLFWQAHIYPEKVAEKNHHPQLNAIKTLCLLSLFFGGLLWPFALVWANYKYSDLAYPDEETEEKEKKILNALNDRIEEHKTEMSSSENSEQSSSSTENEFKNV